MDRVKDRRSLLVISGLDPVICYGKVKLEMVTLAANPYRDTTLELIGHRAHAKQRRNLAPG